MPKTKKTTEKVTIQVAADPVTPSIPANEEKIDFISLTAHQFKKPLSDIKLSLGMIAAGDFGQITLEEKEILEKTLEKTKSLICLVDDLLSMAKISEGKRSEAVIPIDFGKLVESVIDVANAEIQRKSLDFKFEKPDGEFPKITMDRERMVLALDNIISNAVKYTSFGGRVKVSLLINGDHVELIVADSGIGIPEEQKEKLFDRFFRASNAVQKESIGSGLGLFMAKNIIEAHNGKIWFESKENEGATFYVSLPIE